MKECSPKQMQFWRISNYESLGGEGGRRSSARWHRAGRPVVYLAETPPGALIEQLVHYSLMGGQLPEPYTLLRIETSKEIPIIDLKTPRGGWIKNEESTRDIGDSWLAARNTVFARVPSAIMPHTYNILMNPLHPDAVSVRITHTEQVEFDPRLLRLRADVRPN